MAQRGRLSHPSTADCARGGGSQTTSTALCGSPWEMRSTGDADPPSWPTVSTRYGYPVVSSTPNTGPWLSPAVGGERGDLPRRLQPAAVGLPRAFRSHAWPLGYLLSPPQDLAGACGSPGGASPNASPQRLCPSLQRGRSFPLMPSRRLHGAHIGSHSNARFQALPEAGARYEQRLEAVACKPFIGKEPCFQ